MNFQEFSHQYWMNELVKLISNSKDLIHNEVPIAALLIKNNNLICSSVNKIETIKDATCHAEINVIKEASKKLNDWRLTDTILYTTLEPCSMCTGAIINSRIPKVVFGAYDPIYGACGSKINLFYELNKNKVEVIGGILEEECGKIIRDTFKKNRD